MPVLRPFNSLRAGIQANDLLRERRKVSGLQTLSTTNLEDAVEVICNALSNKTRRFCKSTMLLWSIKPPWVAK